MSGLNNFQGSATCALRRHAATTMLSLAVVQLGFQGIKAISLSRHSYHHLIDNNMKRLINMNCCLISTIFAGSRPIGLLVVDRGNGGADIAEEQHDSFEHYTQQTNISLAMLAAKK